MCISGVKNLFVFILERSSFRSHTFVNCFIQSHTNKYSVLQKSMFSYRGSQRNLQRRVIRKFCHESNRFGSPYLDNTFHCLCI